jgi:uncharacterized protein YecT (DUF1311 family)
MNEVKMQNVVRLGMILALLSLSITFLAQAAGFDCDKATTKTEKMICSDSELSKLDEEMAVAFKKSSSDSTLAETVRNDQKKWLKERNQCVDKDCLKQAYSSRLVTLKEPAFSPPREEKPLYVHCVDKKEGRDCGRFQSGKGYTVCEAYLSYLNSLSKITRCEVPVPPGFSRPDWEEIDVMQHLDWAYQMEMNAHGHGWVH